MIDSNLTPGIEFAPFQNEFMKQFLAEMEPGSAHLLVGPVGSGISTVIAATISELARMGRVRRILVLAPSVALATHLVYRLEDGGLASTALDGRAFRLLREQLGNTPGDWPEGAYAMTTHLAKHPDVQDVLTAAKWDLVVVDEAHDLSGQGLQLVEALIDQKKAPSLLMATHVESEGTRAFAERAIVVDWTQAFTAYWSGQQERDKPLLVHEFRTYHRTDEEMDLAEEVEYVARELEDRKRCQILRARAESSISSLEDMLVRWMDNPEMSSGDKEHVEQLLDHVEELGVDSRLEYFISLVDEVFGAGARHVAVFCENRVTLNYLVAAVDRIETPRFELHTGMTYPDRLSLLSRFEEQGGLLMTTTAALKALSFNFVGVVIHYDLPQGKNTLTPRAARYKRLSRNLPCTVYFLEPETLAFENEFLGVRMTRAMDPNFGTLTPEKIDEILSNTGDDEV